MHSNRVDTRCPTCEMKFSKLAFSTICKAGQMALHPVSAHSFQFQRSATSFLQHSWTLQVGCISSPCGQSTTCTSHMLMTNHRGPLCYNYLCAWPCNYVLGLWETEADFLCFQHASWQVSISTFVHQFLKACSLFNPHTSCPTWF